MIKVKKAEINETEKKKIHITQKTNEVSPIKKNT